MGKLRRFKWTNWRRNIRLSRWDLPKNLISLLFSLRLKMLDFVHVIMNCRGMWGKYELLIRYFNWILIIDFLIKQARCQNYVFSFMESWKFHISPVTTKPKMLRFFHLTLEKITMFSFSFFVKIKLTLFCFSYWK